MNHRAMAHILSRMSNIFRDEQYLFRKSRHSLTL
jgi:hypothetical protein